MAKGGSIRRPVMELRISGMADGEHPFEFDSSAEEIGAESYEGAVRVKGTLRKVAEQFLLSATLTGRYVGECDRCLAEVRRDVEVPINLYYRPNDGGDVEDGEDDIEMRSYLPEQDVIVLDDEVRQTLALAVPLKKVCREECKGLCATCGVDLNTEECHCEKETIDPRWEKLADVFKKKN
jgi:uncharacterized protein